VVHAFKWGRVFGDTIFALGAVALVVFVIGLVAGYSLKKTPRG
jgi:nitric oxide reductase subunit B